MVIMYAVHFSFHASEIDTEGFEANHINQRVKLKIYKGTAMVPKCSVSFIELR